MGRIIVMTGVTRGLGRALVDWFVAEGHVVLGCGRSVEAIAGLRKRYPDPHDFSVVDVARDDEVRAWAERIIMKNGPPGLLLNNAAVMNTPAPLWEVPAGDFDALIDVNIKGVANVIRHFVPAMRQARQGVIVNLSSGWGRSTSPEVAPYCASKYAIEGLTKALAQELPSGLAAVPLNPGIIDTDMLRKCWAEGAAGFPQAAAWANLAGPFLLGLGPGDNGRSLTVPG